MDLQIRGVDPATTDHLRDYAAQRAEKLDRLLDRVVTSQLDVRRRPQRSGGEITTAQVTIQTGRQIIRAEEADYDSKKAIDQAIDKAARQLRRFHDRRTDRQATKPERADGFIAPSGALSNGAAPVEPSITDTDDGGETIVIARTKRFDMKPMAPEEAAEQMELLGHDFFLFFNAEERQLNVVYRRNDGSYGLIAPQP